MITNRTNIGYKFENGDIPSHSDFQDIFDSFVHKEQDKADFQMVQAGIDTEHYVTPELLRSGLQNLGIITGNCYMPYKENFDGNLTPITTLSLSKSPIEYSVRVYKNGQLLVEGPDEGELYDYTIDYNTAVITFSSPVSDRNIEVDYWYKNFGPLPGDTDITIPPVSPFERVDQGNGEGIIIKGRGDNYGNVGLNAVDLSYSYLPSSRSLGATGKSSFASGESVKASGEYSSVFGDSNESSGTYSFIAGGSNNTATNYSSYAEGSNNNSTGNSAHAEGGSNTASGNNSHAEGSSNISSGDTSHAEGSLTISEGYVSHAEGWSNKAVGTASHAGGHYNEANSYGETAIGTFGSVVEGNPSYWPLVPTDRMFNVGNGSVHAATGVVTRSDAFTILRNGLATLPSVTNALISAASGKAVVTKEYLQSALSTPVSNNIQKTLTYPTNFIASNYTLTSADLDATIFVNNAANDVTITIPAGLGQAFQCGFVQTGTGTVTFVASGTTVNTPTGYKIKGQNYNAYVEQLGTSGTYYLLGNLKV